MAAPAASAACGSGCGGHPAPPPAPAAAASAASAGPTPPQPRRSDDQRDSEIETWVDELAKHLPCKLVHDTPRKSLEVLEKAAPQVVRGMEAFRRDGLPKVGNLNDATAVSFKDQGNREYQAKHLDRAITSYTKGMLFSASPEVLSVLYSNRSAVLFEQHRFRDACCDANFAVSLHAANWKAVGRRGRCLIALGFSALGERDVRAFEKATATTAAVASTDALAKEEGEGAADPPCSTEEVQALFDAALAATASRQFSVAPRCAMVEGVTFEHEEQRGTFLSCGTRCQEGLSLLCETPVAAVLRLDATFLACAFCFRRSAILHPCAHHRRVGRRARGLFCSSACASSHWARYGEHEAAYNFLLVCPTDTILAYRFLRACVEHEEQKSSAEDNNDNNGDFEPVVIMDATTAAAAPSSAPPAATSSSSSVVAAAKPATTRLTTALAKSLRGYSQEAHPWAEVGGKETILVALALFFGVVKSDDEAAALLAAHRQVLLLAQPLHCTDRVMTSPNDSHHVVVHAPLGKAMYLAASLLTHSCDPNCVVSVRGHPYTCSTELHVRTIRPIMEGEDITVSFENIHKNRNHSTRARIRQLRGRFGFSCVCRACRNEVDEVISEEMKQHYIKASDYYQKGRRLMREGNPREAAEVLSQSLEMVYRLICPPPRPPQPMIPKTHDAIAQAFQRAGNMAECIKHVRLSVGALETIHGLDNFDLIPEYVKLAMLLREQQHQENDAAAVAAKAVRLMRLCYCPSVYLDAEVALLLGEGSAAASQEGA